MELKIRQPYSFHQLGQRYNQEDARFPDCDNPKDCQPVFIVCDGVGGEKQGEIASSTIARALGEYMKDVDLKKEFTPSEFSYALEYAYSKLRKHAGKNFNRMATTMTFICFHKGGVLCAHIGDSRIYHIRPDTGIMYRSEDHSLVNALVHSGNLTPEEAIDHPKVNVITRCITNVTKNEQKSPATIMQIRDIMAGDYFFLCTDGVIHKNNDSDLFKIISGEAEDKYKIAEIAKRSKSSNDNNTAYLIGVSEVISEDTSGDKNNDTYIFQSSITEPLSIEMGTTQEISPASKKEGSLLSTLFKNIFS